MLTNERQKFVAKFFPLVLVYVALIVYKAAFIGRWESNRDTLRKMDKGEMLYPSISGEVSRLGGGRERERELD